jgi:hypothetical protein
MSSAREQDANKLDYALFLASEELRVFREKYPGAFDRQLNDNRGNEMCFAADDAISKLRHYGVRPMMSAKQREETA